MFPSPGRAAFAADACVGRKGARHAGRETCTIVAIRSPVAVADELDLRAGDEVETRASLKLSTEMSFVRLKQALFNDARLGGVI